MTNEAITERLTGIFRDVFDDDALVLRPEMTAADVDGWDSMRMISIVVAVEDRFGVKLRTREVNGLGSVGDLVALIASKLIASKAGS